MSRLSEILDSLPLGRTPVVMFLLLAVSAATLTLARREGGQTLTYWTFERVHYEDYEEAKVDFEAAHPGWKVEVKLLSFSSLLNRLTAAFVRGYGAPDMVDVEITSVNRFFKGDPEEVPFEDLPELAARRDDLGSSTGLTPRLAGSGSTWFVSGAHPGPGRVVATTTRAAARTA